jgi:uncharacterized membrane protein
MDIPQVLAVWVHTVGFVIAWGYYGILGRMILPALERSLDGPERAAALVAIERRAVPLVLLSAGLFVATGVYLLLVDSHYEGLGNVFASTWTTLMLVKHGLVVGLVVLAVAIDFLVERVAIATTEPARTSATRRLARTTEGATALGALIVLLTAAAQLSA